MIAIQAVNTGGPHGLRASFDGLRAPFPGSRLITNTKNWRCTATHHIGWEKLTYDDSKWPKAALAQKPPQNNNIQGIQQVYPTAKWIWTASTADKTIYCRAFMGEYNEVWLNPNKAKT